ncbi:MAG: polysaccharide deacetylase family protein [Parasphingorhabdus sp.]|uniref:polysaccharide deacetylase family protein n=1 Tax=Parasphingorhabdus sp. TaxID=2709688 RepID=UPI003298DA11
MIRFLLILMASLGFALQPADAEKRIAISFDDIPRHAGGFFTPDQRAIKLIAALANAGVKQAGFFITTGNLEKEAGIGGEDRVRAYVAAGHVIANHTKSHPWLSKTNVQDYIAEIDEAEKWLKRQSGYRPWFRFPYLDEGRRDRQKRNAIRNALSDRGLANGYVTIDNYDWHLDSLASQAKQQGKALDMKALRDLYVETMVDTANFYDKIAVQTLGRSPAHVLLLHETDIAALFITDMVRGLVADGWTIITMDEAYTDPIAQVEPDTWFLGSGRVAALAHIKGFKPRELVYERTDEKVLNRLFSEQVLNEKWNSKK